jgi:hypothetical protein
MKTLKLNKNSWHYKFASFYDKDVKYGTDICSYTRTLFFGFLLYSFLFSVAGFIAGCLLYTIGSWIAYLFGYPLNDIVPAFTIVYGLAFIMIGVCVYLSQLEQRSWVRDEKPKEPGFIKLAYRSWKEKFCVKIDFE